VETEAETEQSLPAGQTEQNVETEQTEQGSEAEQRADAEQDKADRPVTALDFGNIFNRVAGVKGSFSRAGIKRPRYLEEVLSDERERKRTKLSFIVFKTDDTGKKVVVEKLPDSEDLIREWAKRVEENLYFVDKHQQHVQADKVYDKGRNEDGGGSIEIRNKPAIRDS
jgi:hypothetical protein